MKDYAKYEFDRRERIVCILEGMALNALVSELFYHSLLFMIPGTVVVVLYYREKQRRMQRKRQRAMKKELREFLGAAAAAFQTGRSVENAFAQAVKDTGSYFGLGAQLLPEMKRISAAVTAANAPLEKELLEFARRAQIEELEYFAEVFAVGRKSGGDLPALMDRTVRMLRERMEAEEEICTVITQKRLEFYLMSVIPAGMIVYLRLGASPLIGRMYGNPLGVLVMTVCVLIYGGCYLYGQRLLEIES